MKRFVFALLAVTLVTGWASPGWAAGLKLTFRDGRVSLDAQDVTIRQILTEWARVGKTRIVNLERVSSGPVTLKFDGLPEDEALDVILRTLPGYMAAPRPALVADASMYDRILIMATTTAVAALPPPRGQQSGTFQNQSPYVTQLRPPLSNPGMLPEPQDDPREFNDPAIAAAAAAGLIAVPSGAPGNFVPMGPMQQPGRDPSMLMPPGQTQPAPAAPSAPSNPWNLPMGSSRPGLAPPPPPATNPPLMPPVGGARPPQADQ